jgi:MoaA/NifB/PqqE/SkfB family radical SAM enzyme
MHISVIIPTYNRKEKLKKTLASIVAQDYPKELFEAIVIDDGSQDGTGKMVEDICRAYPNIKYFAKAHQGPAAARNYGLKKAQADIVASSDDDCILENGWIGKMFAAHKERPDITAVGGVTNVGVGNIRAAVSQFLASGAIEAGINGKKEVIFFPTCNVSFKKVFLGGDLFNESFSLPAGEDLEFFWRLFKKGHRFLYRKDIEVFHDCHSNNRSFFRQAYYYGRGNYSVKYIYRDHPLLKELRTGSIFSFLFGTFINFIKIPRFSFLLGRGLIRQKKGYRLYDKYRIYFYFALHKIMYLAGNIAEYRKLKKIKPKPEFIILDITHRCNLACNICDIRKDESKKELTTDEVKNLIRQSCEWGVEEFVLSGGEALIRDDVFEILEFVKEKKYRIGILTNGILLDEAFIAALSPYLTQGILSLSISLDALTPEVHDDIRGRKGSFEKTLAALKILSRLKKDNPSVNFNVISIILNANLGQLLPLANFLLSININSLQFQPLLANNLVMKERRHDGKYWIPADSFHLLDSVIDDLILFKRRHGKFIRNSEKNLLLVKKYFRGLLSECDVACLHAAKTMLISDEGYVTTCFDNYGAVRNRPLKDIYLSQQADSARERASCCKAPCLLPCFTDY